MKSKKVKNAVVPKLRFPEFQDAGEWKERKLSDVGEIITGKTPSTQNIDLWNGDILFITPTDIIESEKYQLNTQRTITNQSDTKILPAGSIVYTCIASIGKIAITTKYSTTNQQINSIIVSENFNNEFIYYVLINLTPYINSIPAVSTLPIINKTEFSELTIKTPRPAEQQKIADCLSSIDELISTQSRKLEVLKAHKKGLMQQLFPVKSETIPKLRFPKFRNAGEWKEKMLRDILDYERPDDYIVSDTNYNHKGVPVLTANKSFILGNTQETYGIYTKIPVIIFDDFTADKKYVNFPFKVKSSAIKILKIKANDNIRFIYELMTQIKFEAKEHKRYYISEYQNLLIVLPHCDEQQKIADCLTSIDDLIGAQSHKLETLKAHKKGLMQQMFPNNINLMKEKTV